MIWSFLFEDKSSRVQARPPSNPQDVRMCLPADEISSRSSLFEFQLRDVDEHEEVEKQGRDTSLYSDLSDAFCIVKFIKAEELIEQCLVQDAAV